MPTYETLFIASPNLTDEEEQVTVDTLAKVVVDGGGTFSVNERLGRRRMAYPIQKQTDGIYVRFMYDAEAAVPKELERRLRLTERVLRSLTVRLEPHWAADAKVQVLREAQARAEAAEREQREAQAALENPPVPVPVAGQVVETPEPTDADEEE